MAENAILKFSDPDAYAVAFGDCQLKLTLTAAGEFEARLVRLKLNNLEIYHCREALPRIAYLSPPQGRIVLSFPIGPATLVCNGFTVRKGAFVLHAPGDHLHQRSSSACQWGLVTIGVEQFAEYETEINGGELAAASHTSRLYRPARTDIEHFLGLFRAALQLASARTGAIQRADVVRVLEQDLLHAIIRCTSSGQSEQRRARHAAIMVRLEQALSRRLGERLTVPALCAEIGAPERTLRMCCAEFLALSPMRYLLLQRLNKARSDLRHADPATTSVAEIARNYHFRELGRFAGTYRAIFGESPSATLQHRAQGPEGALQSRMTI